MIRRLRTSGKASGGHVPGRGRVRRTAAEGKRIPRVVDNHLPLPRGNGVPSRSRERLLPEATCPRKAIRNVAGVEQIFNEIEVVFLESV